ncbi:MAG: hypothetical protein ACLQAT_16455 [Candidatus Binataceae bacterium]
MNYDRRFVVKPGAKVRLGKVDPGFKEKHEESHKRATSEIQKHVERLAAMKTHPLPIYLQRFFGQRLTTQLHASPNTVASYRDTFRLLLKGAK